MSLHSSKGLQFPFVFGGAGGGDPAAQAVDIRGLHHRRGAPPLLTWESPGSSSSPVASTQAATQAGGKGTVPVPGGDTGELLNETGGKRELAGAERTSGWPRMPSPSCGACSGNGILSLPIAFRHCLRMCESPSCVSPVSACRVKPCQCIKVNSRRMRRGPPGRCSKACNFFRNRTPLKISMP